MSLVTCAECGREVSSAATQCPHCGHPMRGAINARDPVHFAGIVVAILIVLGIVVMAMAQCGENASFS